MRPVPTPRETWLAQQLDQYVRALKFSPKEAKSFLVSQTDRELIELCEAWKSARESAIKAGYLVEKKGEPVKFVRADPFRAGVGVLIMMLIVAGCLLQSAIEVASLKKENRQLRENLEMKAQSDQ